MSEISENSFSQGMDQDTSKTKYSSEKYLDATNFRIVTDKGLSNFSLENIKGNIALVGGILYDLQGVDKITITGDDVTQTLTINSQTGSAPFDTTDKTIKELYTYITTDVNYTKYGTEYNVYYNETQLFIVANNTFTITVTGIGTGLTIDLNFIPAQTNLQPIGSTSINDDIYIFSTNNTSISPGKDDASSYGQIWKLVINDITNIGTLTLIYNNKINFSTYNAIFQTGVEGRYENSSIQRIYWTDDFNKLRTLNVADPQAFALDVSLLDVIPAVDFDIPILQTIQNTGGGPIPVGGYQVAYRLTNTGGAITNFSELSNIVFVVPANEAVNTGSANFKDYIGATEGTTVNKEISWKIDNLDQDYERIQVVIAFRKSKYDAGTFNIIHDDPIQGDSYSFIYDGTQPNTPITLNEFLLLTGSFTHCKTITTKDNRLIAANVRNEDTTVDFDARAFRAKGHTNPTWNDIYLTNNGTQSLYNATTAAALDDTEDTINDYTNANAGFYKPGTAILGGAGPNVSYEFYTVAIGADISNLPNFSVLDFQPAPWRKTNSRTEQESVTLNVDSVKNDNTSETQVYPTILPVLINDGFKYPPYNSLYKGYQRGEIYRFALELFDKQKNLIFTKWIGDIKFPDFWDTNDNSFYEDGTGTGITDFRLSFVATKSGIAYSECFVQSLGIKFTINNLETISDQIDGYSIVRVNRTEQDKTIVSQGYITPIIAYSSDFYTTNPRDGGGKDATDNPTGNYSGVYDPDSYPTRKFFVTPNIIDSSLTSPNTSMNLKIKAQLHAVNGPSYVYMTAPGLDVDPFYFLKYYTQSDPSLATANPILQSSLCGYGGSTIDAMSGDNVHNYDSGYTHEKDKDGGGGTGDGGTTSYGMNCAAYYLRLTNSILVADNTPTGDQYLCNIERTLTSQYGGNTYTARAGNEYVSCSHYRPIRTTTATTNDTFELFGGDIFVNMYDSTRQAKNFGASGRGIPSREEYSIGTIPTDFGAHKASSIFYFAVECEANTDLRHGVYHNHSFTADTEYPETYSYNSIYSSENTIRKYFPKPDPFIFNNSFDNRFWISQIKINGELADSWEIFKTTDYWDVEGSYGPINSCDVLQDQVYFQQDRAFGKLLVNPRTAITSTTGTEIQVGRGNIIDSHDYISTEIGSKHQGSCLKSAFNLFFWDVRHNKIYAFNPNSPLNPLSDIKGMHNWLQLNIKNGILSIDKPVYEDPSIGINGVHGVYDYTNNELIYTFSQGFNNSGNPQTTKNTLVYNERLGVYTGFYSHVPKLYITNHRKFLSTNPTSVSLYKNLYLHNYGDYGKFYDNYEYCNIEFISNKYPEETKIFDNLLIQTEVQDGDTLIDTASGLTPIQETFFLLEARTDYQFGQVLLNETAGTIKRRFRTWRMEIPRSDLPAANMSAGFFSRMKDKYVKIKLYFLNSANKRLLFHNCITYFRITLPK